MTNPAALYHELRELRLWHWQELRKARDLQERAASGDTAERYRKVASFHLGAVQTLNTFFPAFGDTAESDELHSV